MEDKKKNKEQIIPLFDSLSPVRIPNFFFILTFQSQQFFSSFDGIKFH